MQTTQHQKNRSHQTGKTVNVPPNYRRGDKGSYVFAARHNGLSNDFLSMLAHVPVVNIAVHALQDWQQEFAPRHYGLLGGDSQTYTDKSDAPFANGQTKSS